jgi:hypothetical protein
VSRSTSRGIGWVRFSNEWTFRVAGGRPRGRIAYLCRTEREKLIDVFELTLLVAERIPLLLDEVRPADVFLLETFLLVAIISV